MRDRLYNTGVKPTCLLAVLLLLSSGLHAATVSSNTAVLESSSTIEPTEPEPTTSSQESESKGIIPPDADTLVSTEPITPTSVFPEKTPYEQAKEELIRALQLWN